MAEVRNATRPALAELSGGGFFVRREASPGAVVVKGGVKPLARRALTPSSNKENVPPAGAMTAAPKRSLLPDWYPRTPLRDITSIVKALERSRLRDAASLQRHQQQTEDSSFLDTTTQDPSSTQDVATPATSSAKDKLTTSSSTCNCTLQRTPSITIDPVLSNLLEKELSSSIEKIEKMVRQNLKQTPKAAQPSKRVVQRRILMSMR